jgi:hypothetical protein
MNFKKAYQSALVICAALLLTPSVALAQSAVEKSIDSALRSSSVPGGSSESNAMITSLKEWMGPYQKLRKNGKDYLAVFDRGTLPMKISGNSVGIGCPNTAVPLSKASKNIQQAFAKCPNLKP